MLANGLVKERTRFQQEGGGAARNVWEGVTSCHDNGLTGRFNTKRKIMMVHSLHLGNSRCVMFNMNKTALASDFTDTHQHIVMNLDFTRQLHHTQ